MSWPTWKSGEITSTRLPCSSSSSAVESACSVCTSSTTDDVRFRPSPRRRARRDRSPRACHRCPEPAGRRDASRWRRRRHPDARPAPDRRGPPHASRISTPSLRICATRKRTMPAYSARAGARAARSTCPPSSADSSSSTTRWPRSRRHHAPPPARPRRPRPPRPSWASTRRATSQPSSSLTPGGGVLDARDRLPLVDPIDAALVRSHAGADVVEPALARLAREIGIGDQRARHPDHIHLPGRRRCGRRGRGSTMRLA